MTRNCKVIATCFAGREVREHPEMCGEPFGPFGHAQNFPDAASVLELMKLVVGYERSVHPGVPCDTIIVNNDTGWTPGNAFLASLDGTPTRTGRFKVLTRKNEGSSLGGYDFAYEQLADQYDYWVFTEDDILLTGHGYFAQCIAQLADPKVGFVAIQGLSSVHALHAHGGVGATRSSVLAHVRQTWGTLPYAQGGAQSEHEHTVWGEVLFTNLISRLGYDLVTLTSSSPAYTFAYHEIKAREGVELTVKPRTLVNRVLGRLSQTVLELARRTA